MKSFKLELDLNSRRITLTTDEDHEHEVYRIPLKNQARLGTQKRLDETAELERLFLTLRNFNDTLSSLGWGPQPVKPAVKPKPKNGRRKKAAS